jgi:hypothetical protein
MIVKIANPKKTEYPAKLVELELLQYEGETLIGNEKRPDLKEFTRLMHRSGIKKEIDYNNGQVEIKLYSRIPFGKGWRLIKFYAIRP